jgi:tungstate transport system ATP-binding protein
MSQPLLLVERILKQFGARTVLDVDSLVLDGGSSYALTGDNGAGKTTFLRVIAGLETAQEARGVYQGRSIDFRACPDSFRREVIYVHQHPYLFHRSVRDNIAYGLEVRGVSSRERSRLVNNAVEWARLEHLLESPAQRLSAGEKQRVALARARVLKPRLFLLDEPTANLDAEARMQTLALVRDLCDADGTAVIACHDPEVLALPGIRRLDLADGHIEHHDGHADGIDAVKAHSGHRSSGRGKGVLLDQILWRPVAND